MIQKVSDLSIKFSKFWRNELLIYSFFLSWWFIRSLSLRVNQVFLKIDFEKFSDKDYGLV